MPVVRLRENGVFEVPEEVMRDLRLAPGDLLEVSVSGEGFSVMRTAAAALSAGLAQAIATKNLATPLQHFKGIGPKLAEILRKKGLETAEDILYLLPHRYEDRRELRRIRDLRPGMREVFAGEVLTVTLPQTRGGRRLFEATVSDGTGTVHLKWFNYNPRFMKDAWKPGRRGVFSGDVTRFGLLPEVHHPETEWLKPGEDAETVLHSDPLNFGRILPVYPLTEGVTQRTMRRLLKDAIDAFAPSLPDALPPEVAGRHELLLISDALRRVHFPEHDADPVLLNAGTSGGHHSLKFDEFFFLELGLALKKRGVALEEGIAFQVNHRYTKELVKLLPFSLTAAQRRVLSEIKEDMMAPHPMHRLVQGDVGSGKTLVALMAALVAVENGYQVAMMAPTEILAEQHYLNIHRWCELLGVRVTLLTSGLKGKAKSAALAEIASGGCSIVVGTHAVIQDKVDFARLGLGIVDEQHRFGVLQRGLLRKKGGNPDILVMTATPIPRTLAMTVFGDLSLSVVDELPPGRTPVETRVWYESRRPQVYAAIREEIRRGRQAFVIYPLVEETEKSELKAAVQMAEHLQQEMFPDLRIGLIHGRLKPEEKEAVMASFKNRETDILVATTVIEVGIDVPNATMMVIEHAERFGLSQLHQLRGRVGRGEGKSRCILLAGERLSEEGRKRLKVMEETTDGFRIAEADLEIRGPGDFLGTRQAGLPEFRTASIIRDGRILEQARKEAFALVERDPDLSLPVHAGVKEELLRRWGGRLELAAIA
jgi:ATP-dependent DNA helicase RecG